ncbi:hypothetical protein ACU8KH_05069 [Lachancea thermotolerans]
MANAGAAEAGDDARQCKCLEHPFLGRGASDAYTASSRLSRLTTCAPLFEKGCIKRGVLREGFVAETPRTGLCEQNPYDMEWKSSNQGKPKPMFVSTSERGCVFSIYRELRTDAQLQTLAV